MKVSVDNNDRGNVTVDGIEVHCVACDTEQGWAECLVRDVNGMYVPHADGTVKREVRRGVVVFTRRTEVETE